MICLKVDKVLALLVFTFGCQSNRGFEMRTYKNEAVLHEVEIDSTRIIQECYFMNAEKENNWRHQYMLHMLNDKNEAIPVFNPTNQGKSECMGHLKEVEKIIKNSPRVRLCVRDELEPFTGITTPEEYDFGSLGRHQSPYYSLTFDTICNTKECYSISDTWTVTCPDFQNMNP